MCAIIREAKVIVWNGKIVWLYGNAYAKFYIDIDCIGFLWKFNKNIGFEEFRKEFEMSQEKVNKYKEYKKNRKEILAKAKKKQKIQKITAYSVVGVFCAGVVGAIGLTAWNEYQAALAARPTYKSESYILGDYNAILVDETEEDTSKEDTEESSSEEMSESVEASSSIAAEESTKE